MAMSEERQLFKFTVSYFKPSGKWYTTTDYDYNVRVITGKVTIPYMADVVAHLRGLRDSQTGRLPGLQSGQWEGHILVDCEEGYPCLIPMTETTKE